MIDTTVQARVDLVAEVLGSALLLEAFPGNDPLAFPVRTTEGVTPNDDVHQVDADWLEEADDVEFDIVLSQLKSRRSARRVRYVAGQATAQRSVSASR